MIPELGHLALIVAFLLAGAQAGLSLAERVAAGRFAAYGQGVCVALGFAALLYSFHANDFSVLNVAEHSSTLLPAAYRLAAAWGSHEGSMLLWTLILAAWTVAVARAGRRLPAGVAARALGVMGLVSTAFLGYILFASNPFLRLDPPPPQGVDLNPLLQDPGMVLHPPLLYMGYVGFSVSFAFAVAALLAGRLDADWARWARSWTLAAWAFLTLGIAVGSWWAYNELGWGGWWFWDPTENASLMPWLAGTALVHALAATAKNGSLRLWSAFLAIATFSLSLLGTFLVRSGVLSSVHAFALDPARGVLILVFLALAVGGPLLLFGLRAPRLAAAPAFAPASREALLLAGGVLLLVATATVLLGTLYPLVLDALDLGKVSVGPPYFNAVFVPLMAPALALAGLAPFARWRSESAAALARALRWPAAALLAGAALAPTLGLRAWAPALGLGIAAGLGTALLRGFVVRARTGRPSAAFVGMLLAHGGLAAGVAGMALLSGLESERQVAMSPGDTLALGDRTLVFKGAAELPGPNYSAVRGSLDLVEAGRIVATLSPEKRIYHASKMPMTEAAIRSTPGGDIYVALGDALSGDAWGLRVFDKPFVGWLWAGALLMALGGFVAARARAPACEDGPRAATGPRRLLPFALLLLPAAAALYLHLGAPALLYGQNLAQLRQAADADAMLVALERKLARAPQDAEGWYVLGRSYLALQRPADAAQALGKAAVQAPQNARILAQYAEALALAAGGETAGQPIELVDRALALDPNEEKALELAGLAAFAAADYGRAAGYWRRLVERLPADSEFRADIARALADTEARAGNAAELPIVDLKLKKRR